MTVSPALSEKPKQEEKVTIDRSDYLLFIDVIDELTVENESLNEKLALKEKPPEYDCGGFPWKTLAFGLVAGYVIKDVVD